MKLTKTHIKRMILETLLNERIADFKAIAGDIDVIRPLLKGAVQDVLADAMNIRKYPKLAAYSSEFGELNDEIHSAIDTALKNMEDRLLEKDTALQNMGDRLSKKRS